MSVSKIQATKNYAMFQRSEDNRPTDLKKHRKLLKSMELYGFLRSFPIVCRRDLNGNLVVKDGQHRLMIAAHLGIAVYWVEEEVDFDIAIINTTSRVWVIKDYAQKFASNGIRSYRIGLDFAEEHHLPLGIAFALLSGHTSFGNISNAFVSGTFKVKDREYADRVANVYVPLVKIAPAIDSAPFLLACMAVCRVDGFDQKRLLHNAEKCRDKLVRFTNRDDFLTALEEIYNFKRFAKHLVPLKLEAIKTMRERNPYKKMPESEAA